MSVMGIRGRGCVSVMGRGMSECEGDQRERDE